jgi:PAS domain S-box-containing protein
MCPRETHSVPMTFDRPDSIVGVLNRVIDDLDETCLDLPFGVLLCDTDGGLRYAPRSFLSLLGSTHQEAAGFGWLERLTPGSLRDFNRWRDSADGKTEWEQELQLRDGRGAIRTLLLQGQALRDSGERTDSWALVYVDVTDRQRSLQSDKHTRDFSDAVIRTLPNPVVVLHRSHRIITANAAFYQLFNASRNGVDGELLDRLLRPRNNELSALLDDVITKSQQFDDFRVCIELSDTPAAAWSVSGRRLVVPGHHEAMILLSFARCVPAAGAQNATDESSNAPAEDLNSTATYRVLVVDNSESDAFLLSQLLSVMGHNVAIANNGPDALRHVNEFLPDLIITNIGLPESDGRELARLVREHSKSPRIVMAALTENEPDIDGQALIDSGFDMQLSKPVEITELQTLFEMLGRPS